MIILSWRLFPCLKSVFQVKYFFSDIRQRAADHGLLNSPYCSCVVPSTWLSKLCFETIIAFFLISHVRLRRVICIFSSGSQKGFLRCEKKIIIIMGWLTRIIVLLIFFFLIKWIFWVMNRFLFFANAENVL